MEALNVMRPIRINGDIGRVILKKTVKTGLAATGMLSAMVVSGCTSVVQTPVEQLASEQFAVPSAKPGTQIAGLPAADDIEAMARVETEVAQARERAEEQKRIAMAAAAAQRAANGDAKTDPVTAAAEQGGPTVELAAVASSPDASGAPAALGYAAPPLPAGNDALAAQSEAMQTAGLVMADAPASMTIMTNGSSNDRINLLISKYAAMYGVPERLVHRVARRESTYNPRALHRGNYGLMQIRYNTARGLGYDGKPAGLLDAETNLKYAVKYLRGAWIVAGKDEKAADWLYRTGYYYDAKRKGLLDDIQ